MSSILPQYTKLANRGAGEDEGQRLLADELEEAQPTYPLSAEAHPFEPSASSPAAASSSTSYALPAHLTRFTLLGQFGVFPSSQTISRRGATKEETISLLQSVFPALASRDVDMVQFHLRFPQSTAGDTPDIVIINEAIWDDIFVHSHPPHVYVSVDLTKAEEKRKILERVYVGLFVVAIFAVILGFTGLLAWATSGHSKKTP